MMKSNNHIDNSECKKTDKLPPAFMTNGLQGFEKESRMNQTSDYTAINVVWCVHAIS